MDFARKHSIYSAMVVGALVFAPSSFAVERDVSSLHIDHEGWLFVPTLADGTVESFLALRGDDPVGDNITAVWFLRHSDTWEGWAWSEQEQSRAIASVKVILGLEDSTDERWPIAPSDDPAGDPERFESGVLETDPFTEAISEMDNPTELVEMLDDVGWRAAHISLVFDADDACDRDTTLRAWADAVEVTTFMAVQLDGLTPEVIATFDMMIEDLPCDDAEVQPWWVTGCADEADNFNECQFCCYMNSDGQWNSDASACVANCDSAFPPWEPPPPPPPPDTVDECLDVTQSESDITSCNVYEQCDCLKKANVKCMCQCMGNSPWSNFVRYCLQCMHQVPEVPWDAAHWACWWKATQHFVVPGQQLWQCAPFCQAWQNTQCDGECDWPHTVEMEEEEWE